MLKVVDKSADSLTVEFTGADLKNWYRAVGRDRIYICHVIEQVVRDVNLHPNQFLTPDSCHLIKTLKALVPNRFTDQYSHSTVVMNHILRKYHSRAAGTSGDVSFRTRMNLLNCVPDDFVFTIPMK